MYIKSFLIKVRHLAHLFLLFPFWGFGQTYSTPELDRLYQATLKLNSEQANSILAQYQPEVDPNPFFLYISNLKESIELAISEDQLGFRAFEKNQQNRLDQLELLEDNDPWKLFVKAEIKLQSAFVRLKFGEEFKAAWNLRSSLRFIRRNQEKFPEFLPNNKTLGVLHVLIGSVPEQFQWVLQVFGLEGTIAQGLDELSKLSQTNSVFQFESVFLETLINGYMLDQKQKSLLKLTELKQDQPDNLLIGYFIVTILIKNSQSEEALKVLNQLEAFPPGYFLFDYLNYLRAEINLQKENYGMAIRYYDLFLEDFAGKNLVKDCHYKKFLSYWLNYQNEEAQKMFELAESKGSKLSEADRYANYQLERNTKPNRILMKIRLFTDGGYYQDAQNLIADTYIDQFQNLHDSTEFYYRQARLDHKTGKNQEALIKYHAVLETSKGNSWYFVANSSLQLGYLYLEFDLPELAKVYFKRALSYTNHPYKNSIDNKAKSSLQKLKGY